MTPLDLMQLNAQCFHVVADVLKGVVVALVVSWCWLVAPYVRGKG